MCSCHSIPECCVTFSGVKLSIRSFVLFIAWIIVNYSSTRVSWPLMALYDWEEWILVLRYSENNVTVEVG